MDLANQLYYSSQFEECFRLLNAIKKKKSDKSVDDISNSNFINIITCTSILFQYYYCSCYVPNICIFAANLLRNEGQIRESLQLCKEMSKKDPTNVTNLTNVCLCKSIIHLLQHYSKVCI